MFRRVGYRTKFQHTCHFCTPKPRFQPHDLSCPSSSRMVHDTIDLKKLEQCQTSFTRQTSGLLVVFYCQQTHKNYQEINKNNWKTHQNFNLNAFFYYTDKTKQCANFQHACLSQVRNRQRDSEFAGKQWKESVARSSVVVRSCKECSRSPRF